MKEQRLLLIRSLTGHFLADNERWILSGMIINCFKYSRNNLHWRIAMKLIVTTLFCFLFFVSLVAQSSEPIHHLSGPYLFEIYHNGVLSHYRASTTFVWNRDDDQGVQY